MIPANGRSASGRPSIVACHPGTSVNRNLSSWGAVERDSIRQVAGSGWATATGVPTADTPGIPAPGVNGVIVALADPVTWKRASSSSVST
jgi:hypothetical protein